MYFNSRNRSGVRFFPLIPDSPSPSRYIDLLAFHEGSRSVLCRLLILEPCLFSILTLALNLAVSRTNNTQRARSQFRGGLSIKAKSAKFSTFRAKLPLFSLILIYLVNAAKYVRADIITWTTTPFNTQSIPLHVKNSCNSIWAPQAIGPGQISDSWPRLWDTSLEVRMLNSRFEII